MGEAFYVEAKKANRELVSNYFTLLPPPTHPLIRPKIHFRLCVLEIYTHSIVNTCESEGNYVFF